MTHKMKIENVYGTKLNLCQNCGACLRMGRWNLGGYVSKIEPPCSFGDEFKEWKKNAQEQSMKHEDGEDLVSDK